MFIEDVFTFVNATLEWLALLFIFTLGLGVLFIVLIYIQDITQTKQAIRRNYPVVGHFRYFFEHIGEFLRQYFFAMDREELPFNRAQRSWAYRAAKDLNNTVAFGSTRDLRPPGTNLFVNCPFPTLGQDAVETTSIIVGPDCVHPFITNALFGISGMSYGAISKPAVLALSNGARIAGIWMNTGEGGLSEYHLAGGADIVFQIGTAKNGVSDLHGNLDDSKLREIAAHESVRMFEIKMSQGAKPGKGGILPGAKVNEEIAHIRGISVGQDAISPNRHPDIADNQDLLNMISRIREVTGKPVGFKCVIGDGDWLDELFTAINKRGDHSAPDFITLDSADGGTGAAPMPLIDAVGLPVRESLPILVDTLKRHGLRDRVKVICSGKMIVPSNVAWALCVGADFCVSARGFMFSLGCIQALQCNRNTCPTGITTHDLKLQKGLVAEEKAERVANYAKNMAYEVGIIAHSCGVKEPRELHRRHVRVVMPDGRSERMDRLYPEPPNHRG